MKLREYQLRACAEVQRLFDISTVVEGVNLAGVKRILELEEELAMARRQVEFLRDMLDPGRRVFTADPTGTVVADQIGRAHV